MASKKFKMIVPKAGTSNKLGSELRLYELDEVVEVKEDWQEDLMNAFIENGFAIEVKMDSADSSADMEAEIKEDEDPERARNDKGHYIADDPETPEVNEAYVGGKAPAKKTTKKKSTAKKSTKKKS
mgnify:CR=1 FL=1|tara:strand:- start:723 stop:1100 length:378 start_codon:yes stop_codon:yes gene_type:complete